MKLFRFKNDIKRQSTGKPEISVTHDIYVVLNDKKDEGVAFTVGTRLKHEMAREDDSFPLGKELAGKMGLAEKADYRIRNTVPFLISSLRLTEMTKEARGYMIGYDKRMSDFKVELEKFLEDDSNALAEADLVIKLVPSLGIALKLNPGRGFGQVSENMINKVMARPGVHDVKFQMGSETIFRKIDFDRGVKKLIEILKTDLVNVEMVKI